MSSFSRCVVFSVSCAIAAALAGPARAAFVMSLQQSGSDVVMTGSGTIDTTDLSFFHWTSGNPDIVPEQGIAMLGTAFGLVNVYTGASGITAFGTGAYVSADTGSGSSVGIYPGIVYVPMGYVSGGALAGTETFGNATLASLGVTLGSYTDRWGSGVHADSFVLEIGTTAAPEPAGALVLAVPLAALGLLSRGRRLAF